MAAPQSTTAMPPLSQIARSDTVRSRRMRSSPYPAKSTRSSAVMKMNLPAPRNRPKSGIQSKRTLNRGVSLPKARSPVTMVVARSADETAGFPQIPPAPVGMVHHVAKEAGSDERDQIFRREVKGGGELEGKRSRAHGFRHGLHADHELYSREQRAAGVKAQEPGRSRTAVTVALRQPEQHVASGGERREINVLRMAGKNLHRNRQHADQAPGQPARSEPLVDGEKQQGNPRNGAKDVEVSRRHVEKVRRAEYQQRSGHEGREGMKPPSPSPEIHERSEQPDAQRDAPVSCQRQRQREEQPVGRIEQRRLQSAEKRRSRKNVRIPQGEIALRQLAEAEFSPPQKMQRQVLVGPTQDVRAWRDERVEEHR